jgi:hypothetical protein
MRIAILGTDADILRLAAASHGHEIVWLGDVRPVDAVVISRIAPGLVDRKQDWELLLDRDIADAVLVGRGTAAGELRAEQLKRLATEAVPLLCVHPVIDSVLTYYELDMIRRETGGILRHYNPLVGHPILLEIAAWIRDGHPAIGKIHQLTCERRMADTARQNVLAPLARDIELVAAAAGDIRRVSAFGPQGDATSFASLQIQMTSDSPASLRWSVGSRATDGDTLAATLVGERGSVTLHVRDDADSNEPIWQLETMAEGSSDQQPLQAYDAPRAAIEELALAAAANSDQRADVSTWDVATRAMEVVDAVNLSLEKGRTIDVFQQQLTERLAFRGAMAALGCGLLLVGFAVVLLVTVLGGAEGAAGQRLVPFWPAALLAVLAFFLLLQAIPFLASKSKTKQRN